MGGEGVTTLDNETKEGYEQTGTRIKLISQEIKKGAGQSSETYEKEKAQTYKIIRHDER